LLGISSTTFAEDFSYSKLTETLLNQDPDPAQPGDYVELRFKIEKEGNEELKDIEYELVPEYPFSFDSSDKAIKNLGDWVGNSDDKEYYILYYKLKVDEGALEGVYELKMYQTSSNLVVTKEIEFDIRVDEDKSPNLIIGKVETSPNKLIANYDEGLIKLEIVNIGDEAAEQVILDLSIPEGFEESFGYSTRANLGTIDAGASKIAEFYLDTNEGLVKGNKLAKLNIQYKESDEKQQDEIKTQVKDFNIAIFARPEYKILEFVAPELVPGKKADLHLKIQNIGSGDSDSTSIQIFKDSSQPFDFADKSDFIGKMNVNDEGEVIFNIEVDEDAQAKEYKLKLQIRSVVNGDVLTEDETISIMVNDISTANPGESLTLRIALYAIFLVIGLIVGYRYGLKKSKK
jgi:hypothetical protein